MKVIVTRRADNRIVKADMEREIERLFQENKDLRLSESHLRDELANAKASLEIQRGFREEMAEEIEALEKELAKSESESAQGISTIVKFWEEAVAEKNRAEATAEEYHIALMESDSRVDECEKRMDWLSKEVLEWKTTAEGYKNQYEELKAQKEAEDKKSEEICTACNERYEEVLSERNRLRKEVERLTNERDTVVNESAELIFKINELRDKCEVERNLRVEAEKAYDKVASEAYDMHQQITNLTIDNTRLKNKVEELSELEADYDALAQTKREYAEEIDRLHKMVTKLQNNQSLTNEIHEMLYKYLTTVNIPSTGK